MYKKLESRELTKLISSIKIGSILIQFTFLAFPLSMYIVYNKIIASNNPSAIIIILIFLLSMIIIQLCLKNFEVIQKNIIKTDHQIKEHEKYIHDKLIYSDNINGKVNKYNISEIISLSGVSHSKIQGEISNAYYGFLAAYFILMIIIGKFIVIVPIIFFSINYLIARKLTILSKELDNQYNNEFNEKTLFTKESLQKIKVIKSLNINKKISEQFKSKTYYANDHKARSLYIKNLLMKISMMINIMNVAFILIIGRYLFSLGLMTLPAIVTCSLLTVCVARTLGQIFTNIQIKNKDNSTCNLQKSSKSKFSYSQHSAEYEHYINDKYNEIKDKIKTSNIIICRHQQNEKYQINFKSLYHKFMNDYSNVSYIDKSIDFFYGKILDNITLFDESQHERAMSLINSFKINDLIANLPFQINYVITGNDDDTITFDLQITIEIIRELLKNPDIIILDIDPDEMSKRIKDELLSYCNNHNIKLIFKKYSYDLNILSISKPATNESTNNDSRNDE